ncbi:hypothetical protein ABEB36_000333 [Hypothenemus hampei]|uniref:Uncharacterized protein n=1 Tax=Hypothenemus hampei TaxID=57062 RepID=A0ABD1FAX8_HYPHA
MSQNDILNVSTLLQNGTKAKKTKCGSLVQFASVNAFKFCQESPSSFFIQHDLNEGFSKEIKFTKIGRPLAISLNTLRQKYQEPLKINKKKMQDLKSLLPYIPPIYHCYYTSLVPSEDVENEDDVLLL